ncbi:MAG: alpha-amylase family protein, partial [Actinomycetota bacterium]|nr:alpha-amylase family protein [Actinomycetota bacterium]
MSDRWYKFGVIYELNVRTYADSNGDGIGDLRGLISRLDYLARLGVTCIWLMPFYPSPLRDDGYDVTDHYAVHPDLGTLGDFVQLIHHAEARGIRVLVDLVINHTSIDHPWFLAARQRHPIYHDFYVWADEKPKDAESGLVFPGVQKTTWSWDEETGRWYFHRFYEHQADLNLENPEVREELERVIGFWAELGVSGFRLDAAPFLIEVGMEREKPEQRYEYLHELRASLDWRRGDAILLGEANVDRESVKKFFGEGGMHMLFNFALNQHLWLALAREEAGPLGDGLKLSAGIPGTDQWANFLRNHDEVDLGNLGKAKEEVFRAFGPDEHMQAYGRGIRRRVAPMLGNDRRRLELAFSLMFTLPGTPVIYYGDEIGMGDDLSLPEREPVRTPMQWSKGKNGGFSTAEASHLAAPVIGEGEFGYQQVNEADQRQDPGSLLTWMESLVQARKEMPEFGTGSYEVLD